MSKFKVGEVAVFISSKISPELVGFECEIVDIDVPRHPDGKRFDYAVSFIGAPDHDIAGHWVVSEYQLRKKKPPQEKTTWEEIQSITNWNPSKFKEKEK